MPIMNGSLIFSHPVRSAHCQSSSERFPHLLRADKPDLNTYGSRPSENRTATSSPERETTLHLRPSLESSVRNKSNVSGKGLGLATVANSSDTLRRLH